MRLTRCRRARSPNSPCHSQFSRLVGKVPPAPVVRLINPKGASSQTLTLKPSTTPLPSIEGQWKVSRK